MDGARGILVVEAWHFKWLEFLFTFQDFGCLLFVSTFISESMQIYRAPPWNQTSISVVNPHKEAFVLQIIKVPNDLIFPPKFAIPHALKRRNFPSENHCPPWQSISPWKYENLHIPFIWFLFCKSNSCLSYSKPSVVKHFLDKRFNPLTSLKIITKNCLNILFKFSR